VPIHGLVVLALRVQLASAQRFHFSHPPSPFSLGRPTATDPKGIAATQPASGLPVRFSGGRARGMHTFGLRAPGPPSLGSASESLPPRDPQSKGVIPSARTGGR
jgi:hypothetical protein